MAFFYPYTPPATDKSGDRSQDFENLIGNYFITEHQLTRLRSRIIDFIKSNPNKSTFMLRSDDSKKWFTVTVTMEEMKTDDESEPEPESTEIAVLDTDDDDEPTAATMHFP